MVAYSLVHALVQKGDEHGCGVVISRNCRNEEVVAHSPEVNSG